MEDIYFLAAEVLVWPQLVYGMYKQALLNDIFKSVDKNFNESRVNMSPFYHTLLEFIHFLQELKWDLANIMNELRESTNSL